MIMGFGTPSGNRQLIICAGRCKIKANIRPYRADTTEGETIMLFKNARVYGPDFLFSRMDVRIEEGKIAEVGPALPGEGVDLSGLTLLPGLCDIHSHGCMGCDWSRNSLDDYRKMALYYARNGVTSVCATTMSLPVGKLREILADIRRFMDQESGGAYVHGVNLEGPFISKAKKGAQAAENIMDPDMDIFEELQRHAGGKILMVDIAPETPGADAFTARFAGGVVISIAHTAAGYDTAMHAISAGASHVTHLYNAMTPYTHREPGVVGAAFDSRVTAEIISDGIHLHPAAVRVTFKVMGDSRVALISDSMEACGMPNGEYELGGQAVDVCDGKATLADGTIAGSATNQFECMRRAILRFGVPEETAIRAATANPARIVGADRVAGSIEPGKNADLVITDAEYHIRRVFIKGREIALER